MRLWTSALALAALVVTASPAQAGMPEILLTDVASMRVEAISFFGVCFLLCAFVLKVIWNGLRKDFKRLPELSYKGALGLLAVWGLLFLVVLTMISGARELMTPGAWEKKKEGATYRLADEGAPSLEERKQNLEDLRTALLAYAESHEGDFPPDAYVPEIPNKLWNLPRSSVRYIYLPGLMLDFGEDPVVYEPGVYEGGGRRLVLLATGEIRRMSPQDLGIWSESQ